MKITTNEQPLIIDLEKNETLTISSTIVMIKHVFDLSLYKTVRLKVYNNIFIVEAENKNNGSKLIRAFSDTWGFSI